MQKLKSVLQGIRWRSLFAGEVRENLVLLEHARVH